MQLLSNICCIEERKRNNPCRASVVSNPGKKGWKKPSFRAGNPHKKTRRNPPHPPYLRRARIQIVIYDPPFTGCLKCVSTKTNITISNLENLLPCRFRPWTPSGLHRFTGWMFKNFSGKNVWSGFSSCFKFTTLVNLSRQSNFCHTKIFLLFSNKGIMRRNKRQRMRFFLNHTKGLNVHDILSWLWMSTTADSLNVTLLICACHPWHECFQKHFVLLLWGT